MTRTKTYLLPSLVKYYKLPANDILSAHLGIKGVTTVNGNLFIVVRTEEGFDNYENKYIYDKDIILEYKYPNKDLFTKFTKSQFSKFSKQDKIDIVNFYNLKNDHKVVQILYKSPFLKKQLEDAIGVKLLQNQELGEQINYEQEMYNPLLSRD